MSNLEGLQVAEEFQSWIMHPYTGRVFEYLKKERDICIDYAKGHVNKYPVDKDSVLFNVIATDTIDRITKDLRKPLVSLIIQPS